ncbi:MAG: PQQ-binding-like beta-propeller repeat protein [Euryarchaeota archaeon]|nr:PQQ-binding-like beta-propeller repeat protein [Euryarchaeota archaeon]
MARALPLFLFLLLVPCGAAQAPTATLSPTADEWDPHARAFAEYEVRVTNPSGAADAYTLRDVGLSPEPAVAPAILVAPSPTLVLGAHATGTFRLWVGGAAGNATVSARVVSTLDEARSTTVTANLRRAVSPEAEPGILDGRVTDAATGGPVEPEGGPLVVLAADASSLREPSPRQAAVVATADGTFRLEVPPGEYWVRFEAPGYRTNFFGPLPVASGPAARIEVSLVHDVVPPVVATGARVGESGGPSDRLAGSLGLERVATAPRHSATPTAPRVSFFAGSSARLWQADLAAPGPPAGGAEAWSLDYGLDVNADGTRVAVGTTAGTVEVFGPDGAPAWSFRADTAPNSRVPGPFGEGIRASSEVRFSDDGEFLAAGTLTGLVHHFNVTTGARLWRFETAGQVRALRYDQNSTTLFVGSGDNTLYSLNTTTGVSNWRADLSFWPDGHIALADDARRIAVGGRDGSLRAFDGTGRPTWSREMPGPVLGYDFDPEGSNLVVLLAHGVYDFDPTGRLRWFRHEENQPLQHQHGGDEARVGAPVVPEVVVGRVFAPEDGTRLVANDAAGKLYSFANWRATTVPTSSAPAATDSAPGPRGEPSPGLLGVLGAAVAAFVLARCRRGTDH